MINYFRCPDDIEYANICDRVGQNRLTTQDIEFFKSKVITDEIPIEKENVNFQSGEINIIGKGVKRSILYSFSCPIPQD